MIRHNSVGRLDSIISQLEGLQKEAQGIFDAHVEEVRCGAPGIPFGILKACEITNRAGSSLNYVAALKLLREKFTGEKNLEQEKI
jgi:hypothetical protein